MGLSKQQWMLVASSSLLLLLLFVFGQRVAPVKQTASGPFAGLDNATNAAAPGANAFMPSTLIDVDGLVERLKNRLSPERLDTLKGFEQNLTNTKSDVGKVDAYQSIADLWMRAGYVEMAALYYRSMAKQDSTKTRWVDAGDRSSFAFTIATDSIMRRYMLENSIVSYEKALNFEPSDLDTKLKLAQCFVDGYSQEPPQLMKGIFMLREVIEQDSVNVAANMILGQMSIVSGQFDKALKRLQVVIRHDAENAKAHYYLGEAYLALGDKEKAVASFKTCKKLVKNPTFAKDLEKYIEKISNS